MLLDSDMKAQLSEYLQLLENDLRLTVSAGSDPVSTDMVALLEELAALSGKITVEQANLPRTPSFSVNRSGEDTGIVFAGIPLGHEFNSLVLALLQTSGRAPKAEADLMERIKRLKGSYRFETYITLSCPLCPEIVQALNLMSLLNPGITHTMIDGGVFREEVEGKNIMVVPTVYLNSEFFSSGRMTLEEFVEKLDDAPDAARFTGQEPFDVLVVGGGPAGVSAAIYAARKGIRTGLVADRFGGQIMDTLGIENFIGTPYTEGPKLTANFEEHVNAYDITVMKAQRATGLAKQDFIAVELENGGILRGKTVIVATGARWRSIGVPGETEFKNKGIAYCPHCDGPIFKGKRIAVVGGGNSGIEAAIDLAGIVEHVTVLEFLPELKADGVLQNRLYSLSNVTVLTNVQTQEITGDVTVNGLTYQERATGQTHHLALAGVFILIGLVPNTSWLSGAVECNRFGEIAVDDRGATSVPGIFAAGDCTTSPYKQIVTAMGSGATAALSAFDYLIRHS